MRSRNFETSFWDDPANRNLDGDAMNMLAYLRTFPGSEFCGLARIPIWRMVRELRRSEEWVRAQLKALDPDHVRYEYPTDGAWVVAEGSYIVPSIRTIPSIIKHLEAMERITPTLVAAFRLRYPGLINDGVSKGHACPPDPDPDLDHDPDPDSEVRGQQSARARAAPAAAARRPASRAPKLALVERKPPRRVSGETRGEAVPAGELLREALREKGPAFLREDAPAVPVKGKEGASGNHS